MFSPFYIACVTNIFLALSLIGGWWSMSLFGFFMLIVSSASLEFVARKWPVNENQNHNIPLYLFVSSLVFLDILFIANFDTYNIYEKIILTLSFGYVNGLVGVPATHELIHRKVLMKYPIMILLGYCHFIHNHIAYHHQKFGTDKDLSYPHIDTNMYKHSAKMFLWRPYTAIKDGKYGLILLNFIPLIVSYLLIGNIWGSLFLMVVSQFLFEVMDFLSHYGLDPKVFYKADRMYSSWNWKSKLGTYLCFNITYHSFHHANSNSTFIEHNVDKPCPIFPFQEEGMVDTIALAFFPSSLRKRVKKALDNKIPNSKYPNGLPKL